MEIGSMFISNEHPWINVAIIEVLDNDMVLLSCFNMWSLNQSKMYIHVPRLLQTYTKSYYII
jgi:hypothetical protein